MKTSYRVIPRAPKSEVRIQWTEYKGRDYINVRLFRNMIVQETGDRQWFPTKKGIAIPLEQLDEYIRVLQEFANELNPPDDNPLEDPEAETRAQAAAEARPVDKTCQSCSRSCKQITKVIDCPRYEPADRPAGKVKADKRYH